LGGHKQGEAVIETQEVALDLIEDREPLYLSERKRVLKNGKRTRTNFSACKAKCIKE
jgi:hypothetical protein